MKDFFYFGTIRKTIIQFLDIFNDIKIAKYNKDGTINKYIEVPIKFMPKQKFYSWLYERTHEKRCPCIGAEMTGIEFDSNRYTGKHEKLTLNIGDKVVDSIQMPVPYNIDFDIHISTEYINEIDQIIEQILPFFSPFVFNTINIKELDISWDMCVKFNSCSIEKEIEIDTLRKNEWTLSFTVETYCLQPKSSQKIIKKVATNFYLNDERWDRKSTTDGLSGDGPYNEEILIIGDIKDNKEILKFEHYEDN